MSRNRIVVLASVLAAVAVAAIGGWIVGSSIESPADAAARTAPPVPSPILVPVERRVLSSDVVTRGTGRFGLPHAIAVAPSSLKPQAARITTLPKRNQQLEEGAVMLTASGRPVFVLQGEVPAYRDLVPGIQGDDVRQLEEALTRLGFDPGPVDGSYDARTSDAVASWYEAKGWEPFGPTREQLAALQALEREFGDATKVRLAAESAAAAAALSVEAARATAEHNDRQAAAELARLQADRSRLVGNGDSSLAVRSERARAEYAATAAEADVAANIADRARVVLDPRQPASARAAADAKLELARAAAEKTRLEAELAIQAAERDSKLAGDQLELAETAVRSARLAGELQVRAALDAQKVAELEARLAVERAQRLGVELEAARRRLGVQVPVDEVVFVPALPARVHELDALVGDEARGPVLKVTDNQQAIDSKLTLETAPLVRPGMPVAIDEQALGIEAVGEVAFVDSSPGTRGVDGYHFYLEVRVLETPTPLEGFSLRLTIPIESTEGEVTAVPISAVSLSADGSSRVQVQREGALEYVVVEPGLSADGYVEVTPVDATLSPGDLVVVGYENPAGADSP